MRIYFSIQLCNIECRRDRVLDTLRGPRHEDGISTVGPPLKMDFVDREIGSEQEIEIAIDIVGEKDMDVQPLDPTGASRYIVTKRRYGCTGRVILSPERRGLGYYGESYR